MSQVDYNSMIMSILLKYIEDRKRGLVREGTHPKIKRRKISIQRFYTSKSSAKRDLKGEIILGFLQDGIHIVSYNVNNQNTELIYKYTLTIWETDFRRVFRRKCTVELFEICLPYMDINIVSYPGLDRLIVFGCPYELDTIDSSIQDPILCHSTVIFNPFDSNECYFLRFSFELHSPYPKLTVSGALKEKTQTIINTGLCIVCINFKANSTAMQEQFNTQVLAELCAREHMDRINTEGSLSNLFSREDILVDSSSNAITDTNYLISVELKRCSLIQSVINPIYQRMHIRALDLETLIVQVLQSKIQNFKALIDYDVVILDSIQNLWSVHLFLAVKIIRFDPSLPPIGLFHRHFTFKECYFFKVLWRIYSDETYIIGGLEKFNEADYFNEKPYWNPSPNLILKLFRRESNGDGLFYLSNSSLLTGNSVLGINNPRIPILLTL